jgi:hypothetical protein
MADTDASGGMTWSERGQRSRDVLMKRVVARISRGEAIAAIVRRKHMPRWSTLRRWLDEPEFGDRFAAAVEHQTQVLVGDLIVAVDGETGTGGRRATALRSRIAARRQWLALRAARLRKEKRTEGGKRGPTDEEVEVLE